MGIMWQEGSPGVSVNGFRAAVTLKNSGSMPADEIVQLYISALESKLPAPLSQLIGFQRVSLKPGQTRTIRFTITPEMLMLLYNRSLICSAFSPGETAPRSWKTWSAATAR